MDRKVEFVMPVSLKRISQIGKDEAIREAKEAHNVSRRVSRQYEDSGILWCEFYVQKKAAPVAEVVVEAEEDPGEEECD